MKTIPPFHGGQGRSADDVERDATGWLAWILIPLGLLYCACMAWAVGGGSA